MFKKARTIINGIELPEEFSGASVINNIAISKGRFVYVKKDGDIITGDIPEDGKLNIDGNVITIKKGTKGFNIGSMSAGRSIHSTISVGGSIEISTGNISIGGLQYEIDETYDDVRKVTLKDSANDLKLRLSEEDKVHIEGLTSAKPEFKDGNLFIDGLEGTLSLPKNVVDLELISGHLQEILKEISHIREDLELLQEI